MYACPFLTPEQQRFTAFRNYKYQMETRPGMRNLLQQSAREDRFLSRVPDSIGWRRSLRPTRGRISS